jgi:ubiquinone/menaquinone biosynthesis C-methylase UbiE
VTGDFHCIQYAAGSIDLVFSNSLDHAFDMSRLIAEIQRVLTTDGLVVLEIVDGKREGYDPGYFEACIWESVDDLVDLFVDQGFRVIRRQPITYPWSGQMVCLARANSRAS